MKVFSVYIQGQDEEQKGELDPIIIEQSFFSLWAAIFGFAWALYHRMWWLGLVTLLFLFIPAILGEVPSMTSFAMALEVAIMLLYGVFSSELREYYLENKGYNLVDIVMAHNAEEAKVRFITRLAESDPPVTGIWSE